MAGCRAFIKQSDEHGLWGDSRAAANDEPAVPLRADIPPLTIPEGLALPPHPANDDWIEEDLPVSINVLAAEILILDQFLRPQILALFD